MGQHHYITICGKRYALEDLQHGAHPTVSTRTVIARLRRHMPLEEAKRLPHGHRGPRPHRRFEDAVTAYLHRESCAPLALGLLLASLTLIPMTLTP